MIKNRTNIMFFSSVICMYALMCVSYATEIHSSTKSTQCQSDKNDCLTLLQSEKPQVDIEASDLTPGDLPKLDERTIKYGKATESPSMIVWKEIIHEDFEGAFPTGWRTKGRKNDVEWAITSARKYTGHKSIHSTSGGLGGIAADVSNGRYPGATTTYLASPRFSLRGYADAFVSFWYYGEFDKSNSEDKAILCVRNSTRNDCKSEDIFPMFHEVQRNLASDPTSNSGWRHALLRVPEVALDDNVFIEFRFRSKSTPVGFAEGVYIDQVRVVATKGFVPTGLGNDPFADRQYELRNTGQIAGYGKPGQDLNVLDIWNNLEIDANLKVAVIDWVVLRDPSISHPDLNILAEFNHDGNPAGEYRTFAQCNMPEEKSHCAHGIGIAGNIGAIKNNGMGGVGIAPGVSIIAVRRGDNAEQAANAIKVAVREGARILCLPWGNLGYDGAEKQKIKQAIDHALANNSIVLAATGNGPFKNNDLSRIYDVAFPASLSGNSDVISVGASSPTDEFKGTASTDGVSWRGSSYIGPGPDVVAPSEWSYTADLPGLDGVSDGDYRNDFGGTSSAVAKVAGVVALMLSANPDLKPEEVKAILKDTADDIETVNGVDAPGEDKWTGEGRVNAGEAVKEALLRRSVSSPD